MGKLCQVIACEKPIKARAYSTLTELNKLAQKPALFNGFAKNYTPKNDEDELLPSEKMLVQYNAGDVLHKGADALSELVDITARKDWTNCTAFADVTVDGKVVLAQAPVTFLLFLEKQLTDFHSFASNLPTLDETEEWTYDENSGNNRTAPISTHRTKKLQKALVLYPATDKHPAQTQLVTEDSIVGFWSTTKQSGAMPRQEKFDLLTRIRKLLLAVKEAREAANTTSEEDLVPPSSAIFKYLLAV